MYFDLVHREHFHIEIKSIQINWHDPFNLGPEGEEGKHQIFSFDIYERAPEVEQEEKVRI